MGELLRPIAAKRGESGGRLTIQRKQEIEEGNETRIWRPTH